MIHRISYFLGGIFSQLKASQRLRPIPISRIFFPKLHLADFLAAWQISSRYYVDLLYCITVVFSLTLNEFEC